MTLSLQNLMRSTSRLNPYDGSRRRTIGISDKSTVDKYRTPHTERIHMVERFKSDRGRPQDGHRSGCLQYTRVSSSALASADGSSDEHRSPVISLSARTGTRHRAGRGGAAMLDGQPVPLLEVFIFVVNSPTGGDGSLHARR